MPPPAAALDVSLPLSLPAGLRLHPRPKYLSLALVGLHTAITYRVNTILTFLANAIWVVILLYLWETIFAARPQVGTFDLQRMRTYVLVAYVANSLVTHYSESGIIYAIRYGGVALDLLRPVDYMLGQLARAAGGATFEAALGSVAALLLGVYALHVSPPATPLAALAFVLSVLIAFVVRFLISFIVSLFSFWTSNGQGLMWARAAVSNVLSGTLIPLALFPDWLRTVAFALPFHTLVSTPVLIYLGEIHGLDVVRAIATQLAWLAALWVLARLLWRPCVRRLAVQGG